MTANVMVMVIQFAILIAYSQAAFNKEFENFLKDQYGVAIANRLTRSDFGDPGSFGGGGIGPLDDMRRSDVQPAILVHGVVGIAGHYNRIRWQFRGGKQVYATTWGDGSRTSAPAVPMKCEYVKQVRMLIQSVAAYTRRKVDVIGYSMGSPISRKAILGGNCVDTGEFLGPPLTALVDTYVSVAGADQGSFLCILPFPGTCNFMNGLNCNSQFLRDINSRERYEGKFIYSIHSRNDDKVGFNNGCGSRSTSIRGANRDFEVSGNHDAVLFDTGKLQYSLIEHHRRN